MKNYLIKSTSIYCLLILNNSILAAGAMPSDVDNGLSDSCVSAVAAGGTYNAFEECAKATQRVPGDCASFDDKALKESSASVNVTASMVTKPCRGGECTDRDIDDSAACASGIYRFLNFLGIK